MVMKNRQIRLLILLQFCILEQNALAADFAGANLAGAHLTNADLRGSNFSDANLTGADLNNTDLTDTNVTQLQLDSACGSGTKLFAGLKIKPCSTASGTRHKWNWSPHECRSGTQGLIGLVIEASSQWTGQ